MEENGALGETDLVDAPTVHGREEHLRDQMDGGDEQ
ncbi:MAG: hypothetical protein QOH37_768, partial [Nocardioidaceae bacterium]|nr:hypothetical protein [Nocardioidaceae bacterium]